MRMDKLTAKFQMALSDAQSLALGQDNGFIEPEHVMKALLDQQGGSCKPLLSKAGVNLPQFQSKLDEAIANLKLAKLLSLEEAVSQDTRKGVQDAWQRAVDRAQQA